MLPTFPKAQKILDDAFHKRMFAAKAAIFPNAVHPPVHPITEGRESDFQRMDRQIRPVRMKKHTVTASRNIADGKGMSIADFDATAKQMGEDLGKEMWSFLHDAVNEAVVETGNELKVKAGNFTQDDFLRLLEMGEKDFDEQGNPTGILACDPSMGEELKKREVEWAADHEFIAKVKGINERKRAEFYEREARRRLVD